VNADDAFNLGLEHLRFGRRAEVEALCGQMLAEQPNNPDALYLLGVLAHKLGQRQQALQLVADAIKSGHVRADFYATYGEMLEQHGRIDEALDAYRSAVALDGALARIHNKLGHYLGEKGQFEAAIKYFTNAMVLQPGQAIVPFNLAAIYVQIGNLNEAAALYRLAISLRPDYVDAMHNLGRVLSAAEGNDEAIAQYKKALIAANQLSAAEKSAPAHIQLVARIFISLGDALAGTGQFDEAILHYQQAMKLDPNQFEAPNNFSSCLYQAKRYEDAVAVCRIDLHFHPELAELHQILGNTLVALGRLDEAKAAYLQAMGLVRHLQGRLNLAESLQKAAMFDEGIEILGQMVAKGDHSDDQKAYWGLREIGMAKAASLAAKRDAGAETLPKLPYLGDKVVLLHCDRAVRERLRTAGLHGGYAIDNRVGTEIWLSAQLATQPDANKLMELIGQWLDWTRNEAAMAGTTCAVWMPDMPKAVAEAVRRAAGEHLIEITGNSAQEIHAQLSARAIAPPDTEDKFFAIVSIRNGGVELLPHWLEHYTNLGVDEILLGIFDDLAGDAMAEIDKCARRWKFQRFAQNWRAATEAETYSQRETGCRRAGARPGTWILHTDLDELQQYPAPLKEIAAAAAKANIKAIFGAFVDRVAADGSLPAIQSSPSLWEQFPIECNMTKGILKGFPQKVMMARFSVLVKSGHHNAELERHNPPHTGRVGHFKWHGGLLDRMRWGLEQESASLEWKGDTRRFLRWLDQHGGRINLADPALGARRVC
jgi:tetratricopeptide (TPR) repeat protein